MPSASKVARKEQGQDAESAVPLACQVDAKAETTVAALAQAVEQVEAMA